MSDLFGARGRELLERLAVPDPWRSDVLAAVALIDALEREISGVERELADLGADHPDVPLLTTVPGIASVLSYTIAAELGSIERFAVTEEALWLHRPLPARLPVRRARPARLRWPRTAPGSCAGR